MNINTFGEKVVQKAQYSAQKTAKNLKTMNEKIKDKVKYEAELRHEKAEERKAEKKHKKAIISEAVNTIPLNIKKKAELAQIAHKEAFRKEALVAEARSNGASKKEAKKGAEALMCATGTHTHKSAEDSAKVFEKAGKSAAEYAAEAAERKDELKNKFGK